MTTQGKHQISSLMRLSIVYIVIGITVATLLWRIIDLQFVNKDFLQKQANARHLRVLPISAHRGMIKDRNGEPIAVSTPVDSVWVNPKLFNENRIHWVDLAKLLDIKVNKLEKIVTTRLHKEFVYIKRRISPDLSSKISALKIPGLSLQREYRRYYPMAEVASHVLGFTNIDDQGQEGIELAYDDYLKGTPGKKRVMKDRLGHVIKDIEQIKAPAPGKDLNLSIDGRLQYLAYRELKRAVFKHKAKSGSAVILDINTGEVLAMVNQPSFNPNKNYKTKSGRYRNRSVTDVFEPGSTVKPFTVAAAIESGKFSPNTLVDTAPGYFMVAGNTIRDVRNYGRINVSTIIIKSSNIGASKLALAIKPKLLWGAFSKVGFGNNSESGFPGESTGILSHYTKWKKIDNATLSFGYGLSATALQLAHSYTAFSLNGELPQVTLLKREESEQIIKTKIFHKKTVKQILKMLESVVSKEGTGINASVVGYRIAGKTGTVKKASIGGYSDDNYIASFVGIAPVSNPKLVMAVVINEPGGEEYYGGAVAAPVFSRVMAGALRILNVPLDNILSKNIKVAKLGDTQ
ncbi:MAG: peptidoglycan D,D-transpeptidase FtsI family protein [Gammaproteobacteria bacterium]